MPKDFEIKIKATGAADAAKEVEKVEEAISDLGKETASTNQGTPLLDWGKPLEAGREQTEEVTEAVENLAEAASSAVPDVDDFSDMVNDMSGSMNLGGAAANRAAGGLSKFFGALKWIKGLAGPIALALTAVQGLWSALGWVKDRLEEIKEVATRAMPELEQTSQRAAIEAADLANWLEQQARNARLAETAFDAYAKRLRQMADEQAGLVDAELGLELAQIDMAELNGNYSEAEAAENRFLAKQRARDRKRKLEREAIETELHNRRMQNEQDWQAYLDTHPEAREAQERLDWTQRQGASGARELKDLRDARNAAMKARAEAPNTLPREEIDALDEAVKEAQEALTDGFAELIDERIAARDEALAKVIAAKEKVDAGKSDERRLERELESATTGPAAQQADLEDRTAAQRYETEKLRAQQAEAKRLADEQERDIAQQRDVQIMDSATTMARDIGSKVATARAAGADESLLRELEGIATALSDGTNENEMMNLMSRYAAISEQIYAQGAAASAFAAQLQRRLEILESQVRNGR